MCPVIAKRVYKMTMLYSRSIPINDSISIVVPTIGEVMDKEDSYYDAICTIVATPYDMMVQLDDAHIPFDKISDFDLFCLLFPTLKNMDTSLVFGDLDLSRMQIAKSMETGEIIIRDPENDIVIDKVVHTMICDALRKMLHMQKNTKTPGNEEARKYMLERERKRQKRRKKKKRVSQLENYVIALVNTEQFPYNYETVRDISIYQFYASLDQIAHKIKYDNTMVGYYAGTIKFDDLVPADRTWIQNIQ